MAAHLLILAAGIIAPPLPAAQEARPDALGVFPPPPPLGLGAVPVPAHNPMTRPKAQLGKWLFFDKRLSADGTVSCATCHMPRRGFSNARQYGIGVGGRLTLRNVPTVINTAYLDALFWDGRAGSLEEQARAPLLHPSEMAGSSAHIARTLGAIPGYRAQFREAFGSPAISLERVADAIATFERTLISGNSPFDRWRFGGEASALSEGAIRGFGVFSSKANCVTCHLADARSAPFTDGKFHNTGVGMDKTPPQRGREAVTGRARDRGKFKTPTLRHVSRTAPYMHDGRFRTLEEVVEFYDGGGGPNPRLDTAVKPLGLTDAEKKDLVAFLRALEGDLPEIRPPALPR